VIVIVLSILGDVLAMLGGVALVDRALRLWR